MNRFLLSVGLALSVIPAQATNMGFVPGDAFFHSLFTKEATDSIPDDGGTIELSYTRPDHAEFYLCGYGGFYKLEVRNVPPEIACALKDLRGEFETDYSVRINTEGKEQWRYESDAPRLFVYVKDFDPDVDDFGLKYNENWNVNADAAYECFVKGEQAIITDWRDAADVPALPVTIPDGVHPGTPPGKPTEQSIYIDAADVRFFVLAGGNLRRYFREKEFMRFWEITSDCYRVSEYTDTALKTEIVPLKDAGRAVDPRLFDEF